MQTVKFDRTNPLAGHPTYEKVLRCISNSVKSITCHVDQMQIKDLNSGTFGFVQLCRNKVTKETVAIKFIERGEKVSDLHDSFIKPLFSDTCSECRSQST